MESQKLQRGRAGWELLLWVSIVVLAVCAWAPDFVPADAADIQALVERAQANETAKNALSSALKETPNPSKSDFRRMERTVDEVLVTAISREVTGDQSLQTPSEARKAKEAAHNARANELASKKWSAMSGDEQARFLVGKWGYAAFAVVMLISLVAGAKAIFFAAK